MKLEMFKQVIRGQDVRSPLQLIKDSPELLPLGVAVTFASGYGIYMTGKKLFFDKDVVIRQPKEETWEEQYNRIQKKVV